jgi:hypothetical protein
MIECLLISELMQVLYFHSRTCTYIAIVDYRFLSFLHGTIQFMLIRFEHTASKG